VTRGVAGAITGDSNPAVTLNGTSTGLVAFREHLQQPGTFSVELWFKTITTSGGKLTGFGTAQTGNSTRYDRHVYMPNAGTLVFGVWTGRRRRSRRPRPTTTANGTTWSPPSEPLACPCTSTARESERARPTSRRPTTVTGASAATTSAAGPSRPTSSYVNGTVDEVAMVGATPPPDRLECERLSRWTAQRCRGCQAMQEGGRLGPGEDRGVAANGPHLTHYDVWVRGPYDSWYLRPFAVLPKIGYRAKRSGT
jgi:hypothetical protein